MRVLLIKTSSMGDVLHALPAISDARQNDPEIRFDWVVEEGFSSIPGWHEGVDKIIPVAIRRWRKHPFKTIYQGEWSKFKTELRASHYDKVIDAQGLIKSAVITHYAVGPSYGMDKASAREALAAKAYDHPINITKGQHAITRVRQLLADILGYELNYQQIDYGIRQHFADIEEQIPYVIFLHGTTWITKHWPVEHWHALIKRTVDAGYQVRLPWGNQIEKHRAQELAKKYAAEQVLVLPPLNLDELAQMLCNALAYVAVDTGIGHLATALHVPGISLYGPTNANLTGTMGPNQIHLQASFQCSPCLQRQCSWKHKTRLKPACFEQMDDRKVWDSLLPILEENE